MRVVIVWLYMLVDMPENPAGLIIQAGFFLADVLFKANCIDKFFLCAILDSILLKTKNTITILLYSFNH